jgi:MinD-like ATPase involved in chromosome partitioning or flagellar assembly
LPRIIAVHSFRGGTGKSNVTANLAAMMAREGFCVGIVDTDIQSPGIHVIFGIQRGPDDRSLNDFLWGRCPIAEAAYDVTQRSLGTDSQNGKGPKLFLVPSSIDSQDIGRILHEGYDVGLLNEGFRDLIRSLHLDYLFIDTHPGVNDETLLSIAISDVLLLLMRPDNQDFQGTAVTVELARRLDAQMMAVINKIPPGLDRQALRQHVEATYKIKVAALLPLNAEIVQVASGGLFMNQYPEHPFTRELKMASMRLMG